MLVLSRRQRDRVGIAVHAPEGIRVDRAEVLEEIAKAALDRDKL